MGTLGLFGVIRGFERREINGAKEVGTKAGFVKKMIRHHAVTLQAGKQACRHIAGDKGLIERIDTKSKLQKSAQK